MDLQRLKQLSEAKIKAGTITKQVRDTLKEYKHDKPRFTTRFIRNFQTNY